MESNCWIKQHHHTIIYVGWTHQIYTRLLLRSHKKRRTHVQCLNYIVKVVNESATVNVAKLVGSDGEVFVPTYDWLSFFSPHMKKISDIKSYHQFFFQSSSPGTLVCKEYSDSHGKRINILKKHWQPSPKDLPACLVPQGLSAERQWYLYEKYDHFVQRNTTKTSPVLYLPYQNHQELQQQHQLLVQ